MIIMTCIAKQYGCNCADECQSKTRPLIVLDERLSKASKSMSRAAYVAMTVALLSTFTLAALAWEVAETRVAVVNQEQVSWR